MSQEKREQLEREMAKQEKQEQQGPSKHDQSSEGENPKVEVGALKGKKGQGRWGRLPRTDIEKMYENGRRKLPEKYRILLEEYFRRLPASNSK